MSSVLSPASASNTRTNLGLSGMAQQSAAAVAITGGNIDNTVIGASTPVAGTFTTLNVNGTTQTLVELKQTDSTSSTMIFSLYKNSASPAVSDGLGDIYYYGNSSTGVKRAYAQMSCQIDDPTNANEDSSLRFGTLAAGSSDLSLLVNSNGLSTDSGVTYIKSSTSLTSSTYTPTIDVSSGTVLGGSTGTYATRLGWYNLNGKLVTFGFSISITFTNTKSARYLAISLPLVIKQGLVNSTGALGLTQGNLYLNYSNSSGGGGDPSIAELNKISSTSYINLDFDPFTCTLTSGVNWVVFASGTYITV